MASPRAAIAALVETLLKAADRRPLIVGLCGSQGSGKSTLSAALAGDFREKGWRTAVVSLDDLYLPRADRLALAATVHPLLATRGPPGTHDLSLGLSVFSDLRAGRPTRLPRFEKANDDRAPYDQWGIVTDPVDIVLFEGWCVGARPQASSDLGLPVNDLERREDADGSWRRYVNQMLAGGYQDLFAFIDCLVLLAAPGFEVVESWRRQQEHHLLASLRAAGRPLSAAMSDTQISRFIQYYERLTRHILHEMPARADITIFLDERREAHRICTYALP